MRADQTNKHYKVGYVSGSFDMFHIGHLNLIRKSKERCDYLIAGVLPDDVIYARKGKWPVIPLKERLEIVAAIRYVDRAAVTTIDLTPRVAAQKHFGFDAFFTGDDYETEGAKNTELALNALGADLVFFPYTKEISSTQLREKIQPPVKTDAARPEKISEFKYLLPFDKIERCEKIVIYGTGDIARQYYSQVTKLNYCTVAAFTDTSCTEESEFMEKPLVPPEKLCSGDWYDRVVIASVRHFGEISEKLRALGLSRDRVV